MQPFDFNPTTRVCFGENSLDQLGELTRESGAKFVLIVTDPGVAKAGHVAKAAASLENESIQSVVFDEVHENPTTQHVAKGVEFAQAHSPIDLIIGLGGGSAMDCAKGINFILTNGGKMEDYWGSGKAAQPMLPSIGIPTTAGTGSEAQSYALITDPKTHQKMACGDIRARFRTVILDPSLLTTVPADVVVVTGVDAISHAIESFVSTKSNMISRMFARQAFKLLIENFESYIKEPKDLNAAGNMLLGANLAGSAIENSMLGAAHACANPLTAHFDIPHGKAVGMMLPHVVRFNAVEVNGDYSALAAIAGTEGTGSEGLADKLTGLLNTHNLPARLRDCHISETELPDLAEEAAQQWTGKFNPRTVGVEDLLELYRKAY